MKTNKNDSAFARSGFIGETHGKNQNEPSNGLTKREYFAAMIMSGLVSDNKGMNAHAVDGGTFKQIFINASQTSVMAADCLIEQLNKIDN